MKDDLYSFCVPCLFGLEGIVADELRKMDMPSVTAENGRVLFGGDLSAMARANLCLRSGERVLLRLGAFPAATFDQLFEGCRALPWEQWIPGEGAFPVKGHALDSALMSIPDCQKIVKKAVVERLRACYQTEWFPETGERYQIQFAIMKDRAELFLDTTGPGLHKRGYRPAGHPAPLRETLAAAICQIARYDGFRPLYDPMCGSGTLGIEGALLALGRAPGLSRRSDFEKWSTLPGGLCRSERARAMECIRPASEIAPIFSSDIDPASIRVSAENARRAGVTDLIRLEVKDACAMDFSALDPGTLLMNPPYGERLLDLEGARALLKSLGPKLLAADRVKKYIISSDTEFERLIGRPADKRRKLYNGMIQCNLFMYFRPARNAVRMDEHAARFPVKPRSGPQRSVR